MENARTKNGTRSPRRQEIVRKPSSGIHRVLAGMFDLSVLILGAIIIMLPSLIVFLEAMKNPSTSRTIAVYIIMFLTGGLVAVYDIAYRVAVPYFYHGQTLGLRFFRLRYYTEPSQEVGVKNLLLKALTIFFLAVFTLGLYYLIEAICFFYSHDQRGFSDVASGIYVYDVDEEENQ
jgi:membrane protein CcdC involved in cytochrome C biogenesis